MKAAKTLEQMAAELQRRAERRRDVVVDNRELTVLTSGEGGTTVNLRDGTELAPQHLFMRQLGQQLRAAAESDGTAEARERWQWDIDDDLRWN